MRSAEPRPTSASAISAQYRLWRAGYLIGVYAAVRREPDGGVWAAVRPSVASSTATRRGSDVLLTTLDHPGAGVARDGVGEQREYAYYVFQDSCMRAICKEPVVRLTLLWHPPLPRAPDRRARGRGAYCTRYRLVERTLLPLASRGRN